MVLYSQRTKQHFKSTVEYHEKRIGVSRGSASGMGFGPIIPVEPSAHNSDALSASVATSCRSRPVH